MAKGCNLAPHQWPITMVAPLRGQGLKSTEIKEGATADLVGTGKLGRLQGRLKVDIVAQK